MKRLLLTTALLATLVLPLRAGLTLPDVAREETATDKPWCFWYWMHGCVSEDGIRADLRAMQEAGLGGAYLFAIRGVQSPSRYEPAVETLSPAWWQRLRCAVDEAGRLRLKLGMHISDGFALAGGPWITPEQSMQKVVWNRTRLKGGRTLDLRLPQPETVGGYYRDIAVYAYPAPSGYSEDQPVRMAIPGDTTDLSFLTDRASTKSYRSEDPVSIVYEYAKPFLCRAIETRAHGTVYQCHRFTVEASDDGLHYRRVAVLDAPRHGWQNTSQNVTHALPPTRARFFRFHWDKEGSATGAEDMDNAKWKPVLKMMGLYLHGDPRIDNFEGKNGSVWRLGPATKVEGRTLDENSILAEGASSADGAGLADGVTSIEVLPTDRLIDLTSRMQADGRLRWKAPKGDWIILRMGHTSTGSTNATAGAGAGLECDKFSDVAVQSQFDHWFGRICDSIGAGNVGRVLEMMHIDSWECGSQNWTPRFALEFYERRGYDLMPWLPVMAGLPIQSSDRSEQVLRDIRQTQAELVRDVFYGTFVRNAHERGCLVSAESVAPTMMGDDLLQYGTVDFPMGEFWLDSPTHDKPNDMADAVTGAHLYGKRLVQAEGFTQLKNTWVEAPSGLKSLLDLYFAQGLNRFVFHVFVHHPYTDRRPGMTLDGMGLYFQRDQTWWKPGKAWIDYIRRCQRLLQWGQPVHDLAVFGGLEMPFRALLPDRLLPSLPGLFGTETVLAETERRRNAGVPVTESPVGVTHARNITDPKDWVNALNGYQYDTFNPDALFRLATVSDGRLVLPDGSSYAALLVPEPHPMAPLPSTPYADDERRLRETLRRFRAAGLPILAPSTVEKDLGGVSGLPWTASDLSALNLAPDLRVTSQGKDAHKKLAFAHRTDGMSDLFFLSHQGKECADFDLDFRMDGREPEVYDPVTDQRRPLTGWSRKGGRTRLSLRFEPGQSLFVFFEKPTSDTVVVCPAPSIETVDVSGLRGPWNVQFAPSFGGPVSPWRIDSLTDWSGSTVDSIRYYSGTAVYDGQFELASLQAGVRCRLSLGRVAELAEVSVNGLPCGTAWTAPYEVDITDALRSGTNRLTLRVTNTWANRLEGDDRLPPEQRLTWTDGRYRKKDRGLVPAGLLGPIRLLVEHRPETPIFAGPTVVSAQGRAFSGPRRPAGNIHDKRRKR